MAAGKPFFSPQAWVKRAALAAISFALLAGTALADVRGRVVRVLDGDTIEILQDNDTQVRIRLAGIDAPEKGQPWGQRSRQHLARLVAQQRVDVKGTRTDRYGLLLGTVWLNGHDINARQVSHGMAWAYRYRDRPAVEAYARAEAAARARKAGLWQARSPVEPWLWRRHQSGENCNRTQVFSGRDQRRLNFL